MKMTVKTLELLGVAVLISLFNHQGHALQIYGIQIGAPRSAAITSIDTSKFLDVNCVNIRCSGTHTAYPYIKEEPDSILSEGIKMRFGNPNWKRGTEDSKELVVQHYEKKLYVNKTIENCKAETDSLVAEIIASNGEPNKKKTARASRTSSYYDFKWENEKAKYSLKVDCGIHRQVIKVREVLNKI